MLLTLPPLEELVIRLRYGIHCEELTLDRIAALLNISRDKVRLYEMRGMKKLKHASRAKRLRPFLTFRPPFRWRLSSFSEYRGDRINRRDAAYLPWSMLPAP